MDKMQKISKLFETRQVGSTRIEIIDNKRITIVLVKTSELLSDCASS